MSTALAPPASTIPADIPPASTFDPARLVSLDALRGFDMLMIVALDDIVRGLKTASPGPVVQFFVDQFSHKRWEGFAFYDLIFPLFVFMVGVSLVFSLDKALERGGATSAITRVARRSVVLFLLGVIYNGGVSNGWWNIRWMGVLQRIALSYFFASLVYLACGRCAKRIGVVIVLILIGYWALLTFIQVPHGSDDKPFSETNNVSNYIDSKLLPGRPYQKAVWATDGSLIKKKEWDPKDSSPRAGWDPEGILSTLPAVGTCLIGVLAGMLLKNPNVSPRRKVITLCVAGAILVVLGFVWGLQFPVVKKIWTSSFVLVAGGYSLLLLGLFYLVIDVWQFRRGFAPLVWIGSNALTMYLVSAFVDFPAIANRLIGGEIKGWFGQWGETVVGLVAMGLIVALAGFMYRRRVFVRV